MLSPVKPGWSLWLRLLFFILGSLPALARPLAQLSFIHYAHWALLRRIPFNGSPQVRERLNYTYLLFESNFNGTWDQYIEAFSEALGDRMSAIWGSSFGFPGPIPVEPFKAYIRHNEFTASYYWSAYPQATTTMVVQALELRPKLLALAEASRTSSPQQFATAYAAMLTDVQECL